MSVVSSAANAAEAADDDLRVLGPGVQLTIGISRSDRVRVEADPPGARPGGIYRVSDTELATRLSYFLWSSIPDEELLNAGVRGRLKGELLERDYPAIPCDRAAYVIQHLLRRQGELTGRRRWRCRR